MTPLMFKLTGLHTQMLIIALDRAENEGFSSVLKNGVDLAEHYFKLLDAVFIGSPTEWKSGIPARIFEVLAATLGPLSTASLEFATLASVPSADEASVAVCRGMVSAFLTHDTIGDQQLVSLNHKCVADWITRCNKPKWATLFPTYRFEKKLFCAYRGLAALMLLVQHRDFDHDDGAPSG